MTTSKVHSTARQGKGVVRITDKYGRSVEMNPPSYEAPLGRIAWYLRSRADDTHHEHDFTPAYSGSSVLLCACGAVQGQEDY